MVAAVLASVALFAQAFSGTWTCHFRGQDTKWTIAPAPGAAWTTVRWGDQDSAMGGIAYVGYIQPRKLWVYQDFHYDGSYSDNTAPNPQDNAWIWSGTYYLGNRTLHGRVIWKRAGDRIDRTFQSRNGAVIKTLGRDYCTKD